MTLRWPDTLPMPQIESLSVKGPSYSEIIDVLAGPSRKRLVHRHASSGYDFEVWFTAAQAEAFENWYAQVIALHDGEWYAPWIGQSQVVAFAGEYTEVPQGLGWRVTGLLVRTRIDESICDDHINLVFGNLLRDEGDSPDIIKDDGIAEDIWKDDFDLALITQEPC